MHDAPVERVEGIGGVFFRSANPKQLAKDQDPLAGLYEVCVMVFRNFNPDPDNPKNDVVGGPGREFISYVSE